MKIDKMIFLKIPNDLKVSTFVNNQANNSFSYAPLLGTKKAQIEGYDNDFAKAKIGKGASDFAKAKAKIYAWEMFPSAWTKIMPEQQPIAVGTTVAMFARFGGLWWRNACRIIYVIDEPRRFGFAYGTLPSHVERGEELFLVEWLDDDSVEYSIKAFSQPRHVLAKIAYPVMRLLQAKFRKDSMNAMIISQ
jgi:uncharacterized protein (UPF0548 family)